MHCYDTKSKTKLTNTVEISFLCTAARGAAYKYFDFSNDDICDTFHLVITLTLVNNKKV
jgi:hypothetical protein